MSDTRLINKIARWLHPDCLDVDSEEGYIKAATRIVEVVRKHDERLTRLAADICPTCDGRKYIGSAWMPRPCIDCNSTGKRQ